MRNMKEAKEKNREELGPYLGHGANLEERA